MKAAILKYLFCILFTFLINLVASAQYARVVNKDTIKYIHTQLFKFINNNIDSFELDNFKQVRNNKVKQIFYGSNDTSVSLFNSLFQIPRFKALLSEDFKDSVIEMKSKVQRIKFRKYAIKKINKTYCYLVIFPLVKYNNRIYLRVTSYSKKYFDDMYSGHLYFVFNNRMELIHFDSNEVTIDK